MNGMSVAAITLVSLLEPPHQDASPLDPVRFCVTEVEIPKFMYTQEQTKGPSSYLAGYRPRYIIIRLLKVNAKSRGSRNWKNCCKGICSTLLNIDIRINNPNEYWYCTINQETCLPTVMTFLRSIE